MSYSGKGYGYREQQDLARNTKPRRNGWNPNWKKGIQVVRGSAYKPIMSPSMQQDAIFHDVLSNRGHLIVQALAGTGKTATIVDAMRKVSSCKSVLYLIFASRNAREASVMRT